MLVEMVPPSAAETSLDNSATGSIFDLRSFEFVANVVVAVVVAVIAVSIIIFLVVVVVIVAAAVVASATASFVSVVSIIFAVFVDCIDLRPFFDRVGGCRDICVNEHNWVFILVVGEAAAVAA